MKSFTFPVTVIIDEKEYEKDTGEKLTQKILEKFLSNNFINIDLEENLPGLESINILWEAYSILTYTKKTFEVKKR